MNQFVVCELSVGDAVFFPSNFVGSHEVLPVTTGDRMVYLGFFGSNSSNDLDPYRIREPDGASMDRWSAQHYMNSIVDDFGAVKNFLLNQGKNG